MKATLNKFSNLDCKYFMCRLAAGNEELSTGVRDSVAKITSVRVTYKGTTQTIAGQIAKARK